MDITLHQLRLFLKVVETGSVTKAAEALHLTQPAVSVQLKKLDEQFNIPLTEVIGRKLFITSFGQEVAESCRRMLDEAEALRHRTNTYKGKLAGSLRFSVVSTAKYVMPFFIGNFYEQHPGIDLAIDVTNKATVIESVEKNEVDFALVSTLPAQLNIEKLALMKNSLYLVANQDFQRKTLKPEELENYTLIFRENGSATRRAMETYLKIHQVRPSKRLKLTSNEAVKQAVIAGLGLSIMPLIGLRHELRSGQLKRIRVSGLPMQTNWHLIWQAHKRLSPAAEAYLSYIRTEKDRIMDKHFEWIEKVDN